MSVGLSVCLDLPVPFVHHFAGICRCCAPFHAMCKTLGVLHHSAQGHVSFFLTENVYSVHKYFLYKPLKKKGAQGAFRKTPGGQNTGHKFMRDRNAGGA